MQNKISYKRLEPKQFASQIERFSLLIRDFIFIDFKKFLLNFLNYINTLLFPLLPILRNDAFSTKTFVFVLVLFFVVG